MDDVIAVIDDLGHPAHLESAISGGSTRVHGVTLDSRAVQPGDLYAAVPGSRAHGATFSADARRLGALAILTDTEGTNHLRELGIDLPTIVVERPRTVLGHVAARIYGQPARDLTLFGVTGTNGKTTTTYLLDAVLRSAGRTTGLVGTIETRVRDKRVPSVRTTPEAPQLHALLATMRERGVQACSLEVSSQALVQHRVDAVVVDVAGFTNFSQDHLELHGDMRSYLAAKALLLTPEHSRRAVVVIDDDGGRSVARGAQVPVTTLSGIGDPDADWSVSDRQARRDGTDFVLRHRSGATLRLRCPLLGMFNVMNAALAAVMLLEAGLDDDQIRAGLQRAGGVPGRMERVGYSESGPVAVVDYAHTPQAVRAALEALRPMATGRLIVVLGAGGDRDPGKRFAMGTAAAAVADVVIVTDDNPRSEAPQAIRAAVLAGARDAGRAGVEIVEVGDRAEAIRCGVRAADAPGDVLLVAGKGHELGQEIAGVVHPFDDRVQVGQAWQEVHR